MTLQELYDRAVSIASAGLTPSQLALLSSEVVVEDLAPVVFGGVSQYCAADRYRRILLRRPVLLVISGMTAPVPQSVLTEYLCESTLYDPNDPTIKFYYQPDWDIFSTDHEVRIGRYHVSESVLTYVPPNTTYSEWLAATSEGGGTVNLTLLVPCEVEIPATAATTVDARDAVIHLLIDRLAIALRKAVMAPARS